MYLSNIDNKIRSILPYYFILVFITTFAETIVNTLKRNPWIIEDWLINYQGGFVRRGLVGEIIFIISHTFHLSPGIIVILVITFFYGVFLFFSYKLLKLEKSFLPLLLLIFSPFIFLFQINDTTGGFRKDIIFLALMAYTVWEARTNRQNFETIFLILIIIFYPMVILTHELAVIYMPYFVAVYFVSTKKGIRWQFIFSLVPSLVATLLIINFKGNKQIVDAVYTSLQKLDYILPRLNGGPIGCLKYGVRYGYRAVKDALLHAKYVYYLLPLLLTIIAFIPIRQRILSLFKNRWILISIAMVIIFSMGLFLIATDWGRWIYIHAVSLFLLSMLADETVKDKEISEIRNMSYLKFYFFLGFTLLYFLFWHIPHYDNPMKRMFSSNIKNFYKPYVDCYHLFFYPKSKK